MANGGNTVPRITAAEHIGPADTGDNIEAKRAASYVWNGSTWERWGGGLVPSGFDFISIPSYNANNDPLTVIYKVGGSGGTAVATLTLTYDASNNISTVART